MKNIIAIVILIIGGLAAYYFLIDDKSPLRESADLKEFSIKDTASVNKIFMSQPNGKKLLLSKNEEGVWLVNESFPARMDALKLILKTLHDVQILGNVAKDKFNHTVKRLSSQATKVEYFTGGKNPEKTWYIGDPTESRIGTYMLLEEDGVISTTPYVTHMLMERGFLSTRFFLDEELWKERYFLKTNPKNIASIEVNFAKDKDTSFSISQAEGGKFYLKNLATSKTSPLPSSVAIPYFKEYANVFYEYVDLKTNQNLIDSIYSVLPRHKIVLTMKDGKQTLLKTYNMPVVEGAQVDGVAIDAHPERMYAYSTYMGKEYHPVVQNLTFDKLTPSISIFESSTTVEK